MLTPEKQMEIFERAFSAGIRSCRMTCACGKTYYNDEGGFDWEPGELEALHKTGVPLPHSVGGVEFEGHFYVDACACWHDRARKIMGFIDGHAHRIADYLNALKKARQAEAAGVPTVEV
jgi:hypothetical protein